MSQKTARCGEMGIGIESVAGIEADPTRAIPYVSVPDINDMQEQVQEDSARGRRETPIQAVTVKKWAEGPLETDLDVENSVYFLALMLGSVSSATDSNGTGSAYRHTITPQQTIDPKTATFVYDRGQDKRQFTYAVVESIDLTVDEGLAKLSMAVKGKSSTASTKTIPADEEETLFAFKDYTAKFGSDISDAEGNSATNLKTLTLHLEQPVEIRFRSGSDEPVKITVGDLIGNGNFEVDFDSDTFRDYFLDGTTRAMVVKFTGDTIDGTATEEITIKLGQIRFKGAPITSGGLGEVYMVACEFDCEYENATDNMLVQIEVVNLQDGSDY